MPKIQEFRVIKVLFKLSSIFQCFDWYNSHSQGEDVEWKIYITVQYFTPAKLKKITCYKVKIDEWNTIHVTKKYLCDIKGQRSAQSAAIMWQNYVPQSSKSSKGNEYLFLFKRGWSLLIKRLSINLSLKLLFLLASMEKSSKPDEWL